MIVISKTILNEFCDEYNAACKPLINWYNETKKSDWSHFLDLKKSFRSADYVGNDRYVFNIKGNDYRLIALIIFKTRTVFILFIGSHKEYDKINAAEVQYLKRKS